MPHGNTALFTYDGLNRLLAETYHLRAGGTGSGRGHRSSRP